MIVCPKCAHEFEPKTHDEDFDAWWALYPKKVAKGSARRAYKAARKLASAEELIAGIKRYAAERAGQDASFTAHPGTWLRAERWRDGELPEPKDTVSIAIIDSLVTDAEFFQLQSIIGPQAFSTWFAEADYSQATNTLTVSSDFKRSYIERTYRAELTRVFGEGLRIKTL